MEIKTLTNLEEVKNILKKEKVILNDLHDILNIEFLNNKSKRNFKKTLKILLDIQMDFYVQLQSNDFNYKELKDEIKKEFLEANKIINFEDELIKVLLDTQMDFYFQLKTNNWSYKELEVEIEKEKEFLKASKNINFKDELIKALKIFFIISENKKIVKQFFLIFYTFILKFYLLTDKFQNNICFLKLHCKGEKNIDFYLYYLLNNYFSKKEINNEKYVAKIYNLNLKNIKKEDINLNKKKLNGMNGINSTYNEFLNLIFKNQNNRNEYFKLKKNTGLFFFVELIEQEFIKSSKILIIKNLNDDLKNIINEGLLTSYPIVFLVEKTSFSEIEIKNFIKIRNKIFMKYKLVIDFIKISNKNNIFDSKIVKKYNIEQFF